MTWAPVARTWSWCTDFLCSHDGKPSNPKLMGWAILALTAAGREIPILLATLLIASSFGIKTFQMWLQRGTWTLASSESRVSTHTLIETVQSRRDPVDGIEPAP